MFFSLVRCSVTWRLLHLNQSAAFFFLGGGGGSDSFPAPETRCASEVSGMPCRIEGMRNRRVPRSKEWCLGVKDWTDVNSDDCLEEWPITIVRNKYEYTNIPFPCHLNLVWNKNQIPAYAIILPLAVLHFGCQSNTASIAWRTCHESPGVEHTPVPSRMQ